MKVKMMSKTIWKFRLGLTHQPQDVEMPCGARVLSVGFDPVSDDFVAVWALVDKDAKVTQRKFLIAGTGHDIDDSDCISWRFIGTVGGDKAQHGSFVWHIFQEFLGTCSDPVMV